MKRWILVLAVVLVGGLLPVGVAFSDVIQFRSESQPGHSDRTGGWSVSINNSFDPSTGLTPGYDAGIDRLVDTSVNSSNYFFVPFFRMDDGQGGAVAVDFNNDSYPHIGDSYTVRLSFEKRTGGYLITPNCIKFETLTIDNPNGVTDYEYSLSVSTRWDGTRDYVESGLVSEVLATAEQRTEYWSQHIPGSGPIWSSGSYYGELTLTAISTAPVPEPGTFAMFAGLGAMGLIAAWRRRRRTA